MSDHKAHFLVEVVSLVLAAVSYQLLVALFVYAGRAGDVVWPRTVRWGLVFLWPPVEKPLLVREGLQ